MTEPRYLGGKRMPNDPIDEMLPPVEEHEERAFENPFEQDRVLLVRVICFALAGFISVVAGFMIWAMS